MLRAPSDEEPDCLEHAQIDERAQSLRRRDEEFAAWARGYGVISHETLTQVRIHQLVKRLCAAEQLPNPTWLYTKLAAADRLASAAMWLVAHMTYANKVDPAGKPLGGEDFKSSPEGHTGGSLNMVPAYVGYLAANVLTGNTRSWIMGQGHCVAAIEAVNVLVGNLSSSQQERYSRSTGGLNNLVGDFYSYAIAADGSPSAPIGSHVNAHTAGGISEGGYLGFAEVEYVHMPLPGESLVAFLSDGAFEEQRGSDWSPRWWRAEDSGAVVPIMILNGRRIEQRTEIAQDGGGCWLRAHLALNGFDPFDIDGRDPADFVWAIIEAESRLNSAFQAVKSGRTSYPVRLPYAIARTEKGFGFPGAGTNRAHNLPLEGNPRTDAVARQQFNDGAKRLWVDPAEIESAAIAFNTHALQRRATEAEHPLAQRFVPSPRLPKPKPYETGGDKLTSPMDAVDEYFVQLVRDNPELRPRVANPDELSSNHMGRTLAALKHRVNRPEAGETESVTGGIITALNEEAVVGAALGNKGGINLAISYEAFSVKMLGALRQEIIFSRHQKEAGRAPGWISVPLLVTSHTWENGKNEQSHQDPTIGEALLGEMSDVSRVLFPIDANSAIEALRTIYSTHGQIGCLVVPKRPVTNTLSSAQAIAALKQGATIVAGSPSKADVQLIAIGAYQLAEAMNARSRLEGRGRKVCVVALIEPGRFREPRDYLEAQFVASNEIIDEFFPPELPRSVITHTRSEPMIGVLHRLNRGTNRTEFLGFRNKGGTLDVAGMLFANRCTWAHIVTSAAALLNVPTNEFLTANEIAAIDGHGDPYDVMRGPNS